MLVMMPVGGFWRVWLFPQTTVKAGRPVVEFVQKFVGEVIIYRREHFDHFIDVVFNLDRVFRGARLGHVAICSIPFADF